MGRWQAWNHEVHSSWAQLSPSLSTKLVYFRDSRDQSKTNQTTNTKPSLLSVNRQEDDMNLSVVE